MKFTKKVKSLLPLKLGWRLILRLTSGLIKLHDPILAKPETSRPIIASLTARALLAFAIGSYLLLFISWTLQNHYTFGTFGFDLGIFDQ
ncbi:MAG: hypothetical protein COW87_00315, partial [Candidatus Levybacteria bacterium CG22_combo_CG10-13_8_21_14_all_35_11]